MKVGAGDLCAIWITMGRAVKIEPHQDNRLPRPVLKHSFRELDLSSAYVQHKLFPLVE